MKSENTSPKAGAAKLLREQWFKRKEDLKKKNQDEAKKERDANKKVARPFTENDAGI